MFPASAIAPLDPSGRRILLGFTFVVEGDP
jgi:hypothetical protein